MAIQVNGTVISNLTIGGVQITKVQVRQNESSAYVVVFEQGGKVMYIYAGNWKMNLLKSTIDTWFTQFDSTLNQDSTKEVILFPPACYLDYVKAKIDASPRNSMLKLGIQNVSTATSGAYTGQVSAQQAADCGCDYMLVGQYEVRDYLGVTNDNCQSQIQQIIAQGKTAVYCIGEGLTDYEAGTGEAFLTQQLSILSTAITGSDLDKLIIVYETPWTFGTGKICTPEIGENRCSFIKNQLYTLYGSMGSNVPVLFGGTLNASNTPNYLAQPSIDGGLFAGISTRGTNFATVING